MEQAFVCLHCKKLGLAFNYTFQSLCQYPILQETIEAILSIWGDHDKEIDPRQHIQKDLEKQKVFVSFVALVGSDSHIICDSTPFKDVTKYIWKHHDYDYFSILKNFGPGLANYFELLGDQSKNPEKLLGHTQAFDEELKCKLRNIMETIDSCKSHKKKRSRGKNPYVFSNVDQPSTTASVSATNKKKSSKKKRRSNQKRKGIPSMPW